MRSSVSMPYICFPRPNVTFVHRGIRFTVLWQSCYSKQFAPHPCHRCQKIWLCNRGFPTVTRCGTYVQWLCWRNWQKLSCCGTRPISITRWIRSGLRRGNEVESPRYRSSFITRVNRSKRVRSYTSFMQLTSSNQWKWYKLSRSNWGRSRRNVDRWHGHLFQGQWSWNSSRKMIKLHRNVVSSEILQLTFQFSIYSKGVPRLNLLLVLLVFYILLLRQKHEYTSTGFLQKMLLCPHTWSCQQYDSSQIIETLKMEPGTPWNRDHADCVNDLQRDKVKAFSLCL